MDPDKVQAILNVPALNTAKALIRFLGQIRMHSRMLRYLAEFVTPLHTALNRVTFQCSTKGEDVYRSLKVILLHAPVVKPPNWSQPFHVFITSFDMAIESALMQMMPVYYTGRQLVRST